MAQFEFSYAGLTKDELADGSIATLYPELFPEEEARFLARVVRRWPYRDLDPADWRSYPRLNSRQIQRLCREWDRWSRALTRKKK